MKLLTPSLSATPLVAALAMGLSACGGSSDTLNNSGNGSSQLSIAITDAPIDSATSVVVNVTGLELKPAVGSSQNYVFCEDQTTAIEADDCDNTEAKAIDLHTLTGSRSMDLLDEVDINPGTYNWIRLALDDANPAYIDLEDGSRHLLEIPSASQSGLKLNRGFTATQGSVTHFTIDVDLRKSIHQTGNGVYKMRPSLRIVDNSEAGHLTGQVASILIDDNCSPAVYLFEGANANADDAGANGEPVASAIVALDNDSNDYRFEIGFLEAGSYTAALTCEADLDDPDSNDDIEFLLAKNATVTAQEETEILIQNSQLGTAD